MSRKVIVLVLIALFVVGTLPAMAGGDSACKGALQSMYDWFKGCDKPCAKTAVNVCCACNKPCCDVCKTDCGGKCCSSCVKK